MKLAVTKDIEIEDELVDKIVIEALKKDYDTIYSILKGNQKVNSLSDENEDDENFVACTTMLKYYMDLNDYYAFVKSYPPIYAARLPVGDIGFGLGKNSSGRYDKQLLVEALKENVLDVAFYKVDGSVRYMQCTLLDEYIEDYDYSVNPKRVTDPDLIHVWDVDLGEWRSFKVNRLISVEVDDDIAMTY